MPPGRNAMPVGEGKPTPALMKDAKDKGSGPNVTKPSDTRKAPGVTEPGADANRNMT